MDLKDIGEKQLSDDIARNRIDCVSKIKKYKFCECLSFPCFKLHIFQEINIMDLFLKIDVLIISFKLAVYINYLMFDLLCKLFFLT